MFYKFGKFSLAFYEPVHFVIGHRFAELHSYLIVFVKQVCHLLDTLPDYFDDGFVRIHLRFLLQIAHAVTRRPYDFTLVRLLHPCYNFHQSGFSGAVETNDAYLCPIKEG